MTKIKNYDKKLHKNQRFLESRFGKDFERVLGGFWEPKILNVRTLFHVFSKSFLNCVSKSKKRRLGVKNAPT